MIAARVLRDREKQNMAGILERKVALVTGGASGIGRATSLAMAREGARVAVADRTEESAAGTVALINAAGGQAIAIGGDVTAEADVAAMVARTVAAYGRIDCAFNNAGVNGGSVGPGRQRLHELSQVSFDTMLAINLTGVWLCMKHEIIQMMAQGRRWRHRQHRLDRRTDRACDLRALRGGQARRGGPDQDRGDRIRPGRHPRELRQSRLHHHADDRGSRRDAFRFRDGERCR
jgi:NAD(P)-dependent dehydrogenase (short-subunit alcohol dehydrogenase family)